MRVGVSPSFNRKYDRGIDGNPGAREWALLLGRALVESLWDAGHQPLLLKPGDATVSYRLRVATAEALGCDFLLSIRPTHDPDAPRGASALVGPAGDEEVAKLLNNLGARALGVPVGVTTVGGNSELDSESIPSIQLQPANLAHPEDALIARQPETAGRWARAIVGGIGPATLPTPPSPSGIDWEVWIDAEKVGVVPGVLEDASLWAPMREILRHSDLELSGLESVGRRILLTRKSRPWWSLVGAGEGSTGEIELALHLAPSGAFEDGVFSFRGEGGDALALRVEGGKIRDVTVTMAGDVRGTRLVLDLDANLETQELAGEILIVKGRVAVSAILTPGMEEARVSWRGERGSVEAAWGSGGWELKATFRV